MTVFTLSCKPSSTTALTDLETAHQVLVEYLELLHTGDYKRAVNYIAEDPDFWGVLQDNNPDISGDRATLLSRSCEQQGVCLQVRQVVNSKQVTATEFSFVIEFSREDGYLFVLGPCCGANETDMPPQSQFVYRVVKVEGQYKVYGGPIYVP